MHPIIIGVAGGTGSGKTTVAETILKRVGEGHIAYISHDSYYRDLANMPRNARAQVNFDHPDSLETDLKESILEDIQADYPFLQEGAYTQNVEFDSSGHNYGFELRWYPSGANGSFSLGVSVEKTSMKVGLTEITSSLSFTDGSSFDGTTSGEFLIKPLAFLLSVRWDLIPSARLTPYITLGLGGAMISSIEDGEVSWSYTGELDIDGQAPEQFSDSETKTIKELIDELEEEDEEFIGLGFIPFVMLNLGLKGKLAENIHLLVDAGVWNGLVLRGGVALRF